MTFDIICHLVELFALALIVVRLYDPPRAATPVSPSFTAPVMPDHMVTHPHRRLLLYSATGELRHDVTTHRADWPMLFLYGGVEYARAEPAAADGDGVIYRERTVESAA